MTNIIKPLTTAISPKEIHSNAVKKYNESLTLVVELSGKIVEKINFLIASNYDIQLKIATINLMHLDQLWSSYPMDNKSHLMALEGALEHFRDAGWKVVTKDSKGIIFEAPLTRSVDQ